MDAVAGLGVAPATASPVPSFFPPVPAPLPPSPAEGRAVLADVIVHNGVVLDSWLPLDEAARAIKQRPSVLRRWADERKVWHLRSGRNLTFLMPQLVKDIMANVMTPPAATR